MFRLAGWIGLVTLGLILSSCGQPQQPASEVNPQGTLEISLQGIAQAPVNVFRADNPNQPVFSESVAGTADVTLGAGSYSIDGAPVQGAADPAPATVVVKAGQTTRVVLAYQEIQSPSAPATALEITKVTDGTGAPLPGLQEENINKDVIIYASQTEEAMCVTVTATDSTGAPVSNAPVVVNVSDGMSWLSADRIAVLRGCASAGSVSATMLMPASFRDGIYTGADGTATFTLYATTGIQSGPELLSPESDLAKVVVAVENEDNTTVLNEFKAVFFNLAHLWASFEGSDPVPTDQRVGKAFPTIINLWNEKDFGANTFDIATILYQKQPQQELDVRSVGWIRYQMVQERNKDWEMTDVAHFEGCSPYLDSSGIETCDDSDGHVSIVPNAGTHLEDMPIKVQVRATLMLGFSYGQYKYVFALKDYDVYKRWIGSYLRITKSVDHHVLTWAGEPDDEKTLDAANAVPENSVFTATFTLTATNEGTENVYDVSIADLLPAELGIIESSIDPSGGTYDAVKHAVTWNYQQNASVAGFQMLAPGESVSVTFEVYVRQKPGYCVDREDLFSSIAYASRWMFALQPDNDSFQQDRPCYDDPYDVVNGGGLHDVTASWFSAAPSDQGGIQAVTDFNGFLHEDDVVIYAVRPEFAIDKSLANPLDAPFLVGEDALFDVTVRNLDLLDPGIDRQDMLPYAVSYEWLMDKYPGEFNGSPRDNPYGSNVALSDVFSVNLDFNDATALLLHDDDGVNPDQAFASIHPSAIGWYPEDKGITWATIPLMGGGDMAQTRVTLDHDGASFNVNLAGMTADNLNQFDLGDCFRYEGVIGAPDMTSHIHRSFNLITDCAFTWSEIPRTPWLELDSVGTGEYLLGGNTVTFHNTVQRGDPYFYVFSLLNNGDSDALMATNVVTIDNTTSASITGGTAYYYDGGSFIGTASGVVDNSGQISFGPVDHPAGWTVYYVIDVQANQIGNVTATSTVDYDADSTDAQYGLLPLTMSEIVSIQPPF